MGNYRKVPQKKKDNRVISISLPKSIVEIMDMASKRGLFINRSDLVRCLITPWALDLYKLMQDQPVNIVEFQPTPEFIQKAKAQKLIP